MQGNLYERKVIKYKRWDEEHKDAAKQLRQLLKEINISKDDWALTLGYAHWRSYIYSSKSKMRMKAAINIIHAIKRHFLLQRIAQNTQKRAA